MPNLHVIPRFNGLEEDKKLSAIERFVVAFWEDVERALSDIGSDNLSSELYDKLNSLGASLEKNKTEINENARGGTQGEVNIMDIVTSALFKNAVKGLLNFRVNFDTGELEYDEVVNENEGGNT
jgi:hypothetical protein